MAGIVQGYSCYPLRVNEQGTVSPAEVRFRSLTRDDEGRIIELLRVAIYGAGFPDLAAYWRWKHYENPFGESFGLVAEVEERIVGLRVFMRWHLRAGGRVVRTGRAVDTAVHPDWRRRGFFERMTLGMVEPMTAQGLDLTFNTPNAMSLPGYMKMGWADLGRLPLRVRVRRPLRLLRGVAGSRGLTRADADGSGEVDNGRVSALLRDSAVIQLVEEVDAARAAPAAEAPGAAALPRAARLRTVLTPEYLEWHYGRNRWVQYEAAYDVRGAEAALIIGRPRSRGGLTELLIAEVVASPTRRGSAAAARVAAQLASRVGADYVAVSGLGDTFGLRLGYVPVGRRGIDVTLRPLHPSLPVDPTSWAGWAAGIGDLELF